MGKIKPVVVSGAVEGIVDEAVLRRLVKDTGGTLGPVHGKNGKSQLIQKLDGYNRAAKFSPWVVLLDLNQEDDCAPPLKASRLPAPAPNMCFRIAVREIEAWLLADKERLARFLCVPSAMIPSHPEKLDNPKKAIVDLAKRSSRRDIREDIIPREGSGRPVGPAYASRMIEFAENLWQPAVASKRSDSLRRCRKRIQELVKKSK